MKLHKFLFASLFFCSLFLVEISEAVKIRFPKEELSLESVLPIFTPVNAVLNRTVVLKHHFEFGVYGSIGLREPFYFPFYGGGILSFYLSEVHGINITGNWFPPYYSNSGGKLALGKGLEGGQTFQAQKIPHPLAMITLNYQYTPFYGKISLTKSFTMNSSIYGFVGPGMIISSDKKYKFPSLQFGLGQKLYFNRRLSLRTDASFYGYYGPAPATLKLDDNFQFTGFQKGQKKIVFNLMLSAGFSVLL